MTGPRGPTAGPHRVRRAILWLDARDWSEWVLGFAVAAVIGVLLLIATLIVASIRRGNAALATGEDFVVLLLVLGVAMAVVVVWTVCWRGAVAWARCRPACPPETLAAPDPFEEAARREVEELTRDTP